MAVFRAPGVQVHLADLKGDNETDPIEYALRAMEAEEDAQGWDRKARFFWIALQQGVGVIVSEAILPPDLFDRPPDGLEVLAGVLADEDGEGTGQRMVEKGMLPDNLHGVMFMVEGWSVKRTQEQMDAPGVRPSQAADREETRTVTAITYGLKRKGEPDSAEHANCGELHWLARIRGEVPEYKKYTHLFHTPAGQIPEMSGRVPNALGHVFVHAMNLSRRDPVVL